MFYRESGQFKESYQADQAFLPLRQDRYGLLAWIFIGFVVIPLFASDYLLSSVLLQFLPLLIAAIGLNLLTGYAGQLSLGSGGFMAVGAVSAYKLSTGFPELNIVWVLLLSGFITAAVGTVFGLPSLRIKGFYLAVATLASQFFLIWMLNKFPWFINYTPSGVISAPPRAVFGDFFVTGSQSSPVIKYLFTLCFVAVLTVVAANLARSNIGRQWRAIRDMDIAAEIMGVPMLSAKLKAFAVSSFYCGVAGALWAFVYTGGVEPLAFDIDRSFQILFIIIIGGLGSILGSYVGAAFIVAVPILLTNIPHLIGLDMPIDLATHLEQIIFGSLIIAFLVFEPHGLARIWQTIKSKLRCWPFPH